MNRMMPFIVVALLADTTAALAQSQPSDVQGQWQQDYSKSTDSRPHGSADTLQLGTNAEGDLTVKNSQTDADGNVNSSQVVGRADGKPYPVQGNAQYATTSTKRGADGSVTMDINANGGGTTQTCKVSADNKQLTCDGTATDADGTSTPFTHVYSRQ